jgi:hypothetical protein
MRFIIAIILLVLTGCGQKTIHSSKDEIGVIVAFLQTKYGSYISAGTPLVIKDTLSCALLGQSHEASTLSLLSGASDDIPEDLIKDFCDKNAKPQAVWPELALHIKVELVSGAELNAIFSATRPQKPDGWDKFYAKYPKSPGVITISRVGFSRKGDRAMFYMGSQSHWLAGSGRIHIFRKQHGKWVEEPYSFGPSWVS